MMNNSVDKQKQNCQEIILNLLFVNQHLHEYSPSLYLNEWQKTIECDTILPYGNLLRQRRIDYNDYLDDYNDYLDNISRDSFSRILNNEYNDTEIKLAKQSITQYKYSDRRDLLKNLTYLSWIKYNILGYPFQKYNIFGYPKN